MKRLGTPETWRCLALNHYLYLDSSGPQKTWGNQINGWSNMKTVSLVAHIKIEHLPFRGAQAMKKHTESSFSVKRYYKVTYRISALINTFSKAIWDKFFRNREPVTNAANLKWRKTYSAVNNRKVTLFTNVLRIYFLPTDSKLFYRTDARIINHMLAEKVISLTNFSELPYV